MKFDPRDSSWLIVTALLAVWAVIVAVHRMLSDIPWDLLP
jgi:hypothetical protein